MLGTDQDLEQTDIAGSAAEPTCSVLICLSPIPGPDGKMRLMERVCRAGLPVSDYIPTRQQCIASINGGVVPIDEWGSRVVEDGEQLLLKPQLGDPATILVGLLLIAVSIGVQVAIAHLWPPPKPKFAEQDDATYGFGGISTTVGPGAKIPVVYGRHRVGGQILQASIDPGNIARQTTDGNDITLDDTEQQSHLNLLLALSEGEIEEIETSTIELNGQPIANFPNVTTYTRTGTAGQTVIPLFSETRNTFADGREITAGGITYTTTQDINAYVLNVTFNEGLVGFQPEGDKFANTSVWRVRHRVSPAGAWSSWNTVSVRAMKTSIVRVAVPRVSLALDTYDINIEWVSQTFYDINVARYKPFLESVTEIQDGAETYPNTALLGLETVATENLQGSIPNVTVVVKGKKVRSTTFGATPAYSQNPAWCLMDFLTNARYGLGIADGEINLPAFVTYGNYCNETVDGEARHLLDYVLVADAEEAIEQIVTSSRATIYKLQGTWTPRILQDETPVQLISWTNCTNVKLTYTKDPDRINVMEGRFADLEEGWEQNVLTWPDVDIWPATVRKSNISLNGITRRTAVVRALQYELNRRTLPKLILQADCSLDALALAGNDVFRFSHPLPGWGVSGRIQAGSTTTVINLDEEVTFTGGGVYHLYVRHEDDTVETKAVINPGASTVKQITLSSALAQVPVALTSVYAFGLSTPTDTAIREFRLTSLERLTDNTIRITAVQHNATIYDDATASVLPVISDLFNPLGPPPAIASLIATEFPRVGPDGRSRIVVNLSWDVAALSAGYAPYGGAIIYRREVRASSSAGVGIMGEALLGQKQGAGDGTGDYIRIATVGPTILDYDDPLVITGATYQYKVVPISHRGIPNQIGTATVTINVTGPTTPDYFPGTIANLRLKGQAVGQTSWEGRDVHIEWDKLTSALFTETFFLKDYVVEIWAPGQAYLLRRTATTDTSYSYTQDMNFEDQVQAGMSAARRDLMFIVRGRTNTNRQSIADASITVTNPAPDMSAITPTTTALFEAGIVDWTQYTEPRDFDHFQVYLDIVTPPLDDYQSTSIALKKIFPTGLTAGSTYYVQIVPYDTFGVGTASAVASFTPTALDASALDTTAPATPTGLALVAALETATDGVIRGRITATWTANTESDMDVYRLKLRESSGAEFYRTVPFGQTQTLFTGLTPNTLYYVSIQATDVFGNKSAFSAESSTTTPTNTTAPAVPSGLTLVAGFKVIGVKWTANSESDLLGYFVQRSDSGAFAGEEVTLGPKYVNFWVDNDLAVDTAYWYRLKARNTSGTDSAYSSSATTTTLQVGSADIAANAIIANKILAGVIDATKLTVGLAADVTEGTTAYSGTVVYRATGAPTNVPTPNGITTTDNSNGTRDITLEWAAYTQGANQADNLILFWRADGTEPTVNDNAVMFNVNTAAASSYTFHGVAPDTTYSFGLAAVRRTENGIEIGAIQAPTAAPDWRGVVGSTPDYTANVGGTSAATVVTNAANGATAFSGTVTYRTTGAPTNNPTPNGITTVDNSNGTRDIELQWAAYTQGANQADNLVLFWRTDGSAPTVNDNAVVFNVNTSGASSYRFYGVAPDTTYSFGLAASRRTENGTEIGTIQAPTTAPDWRGVVGATPDYTANVGGTVAATVVSNAANGQTVYNDPITRANALSTVLLPGLVQVSGATTLADWREGGDLTKIAGGQISANTITANKLTIGHRNVKAAGIQFTANDPGAAQVSWTVGTIAYINDAGTDVTVSIAAGNSAALIAGTIYVYWVKGATALSSTETRATAFGADNVVLATYNGGDSSTLVTDIGQTIIEGASIKTGSVNADRLVANSITSTQLATSTLITNAAQIQNALIDSAHIATGAIDTAHIGLLQVTSATIADLTVGTIKITANAVTLGVATTSAVNLITSTESIYMTLSFDVTDMVYVYMWASAWQSTEPSETNGPITWRLRRDTAAGTLLNISYTSIPSGAYGTALSIISWVDVSAESGSKTFVLTSQVASGESFVEASTKEFMLLGIKK